jgi:hypothetical protein
VLSFKLARFSRFAFAIPAPHTIVLFMISALALNLTPGPAILFVLSRALAR